MLTLVFITKDEHGNVRVTEKEENHRMWKLDAQKQAI
jgi:hypothetical protein